jgi:hypothetical protein
MNKHCHTAQQTSRRTHLPRHYYPGYVFIPKEGYFQARKIGLTAKRVSYDPLFHKTRLLAHEFAQLAAQAKLIRQAFCTPAGIKDKPHRLQSLLLQALQQDEKNIYGCRNLFNGNLHVLEDYNFNKQALLQDICAMEWELTYQATTKQFQLQLPSFVPLYFIQPPSGSTHCRIYLTTAVFDFQQYTYSIHTSRTSLIPLRRIHFPATTLTTPAEAIAGSLSITALGITWYAAVENNHRIIPAPIPGPLAIVAAAWPLATC